MAYLFQRIDDEIYYRNQRVAVLVGNTPTSLRDKVTAAIESYESDREHTDADMCAEYDRGRDAGYAEGDSNADRALAALNDELEEARDTIARLEQRIDELLALEASQVDSGAR